MQIKHRLIRGIVRAASEISPRRVGRAVFWQACRTLPTKPNDHTIVAKAEQRLTAAKRSTVVWGGNAAAVYTFEPAQSTGFDPLAVRTVALVHGWTGRAAFMTPFAAALTRVGMRVVAIDLPGHGASSGRMLHLPLAVDTLHAVHRETGPWYAMAGHSFGGLVAMAAAAGTVAFVPAVPVQRLAIVAAPNDAQFVFDTIGQTAGLGQRAKTALDEMVMEVAGRPISHFDGATMIRTAGARTLVMHAPDDREIPFACAETLAKNSAELSTLAPIVGAGHRRILNSPAACELLAVFMSAGLSVDERCSETSPREWLN